MSQLFKLRNLPSDNADCVWDDETNISFVIPHATSMSARFSVWSFNNGRGYFKASRLSFFPSGIACG